MPPDCPKGVFKNQSTETDTLETALEFSLAIKLNLTLSPSTIASISMSK
ncbi:hypothetical protein VCRA2127O344_170009 [Vibrio crassostreae]|nr:hypothetical protein VCRA2127O344_170009 [Vibrio crassostreae]